MYRAKESEERLNRHAMTLYGDDLSFRVYYWGWNTCHYDNPVHKHSFWEICYVVDGEGSYAENGHEYPLSQGTFFCSKPGNVHQIRSQSGLNLLYVAFEIMENHSALKSVQHYQQLLQEGAVCLSPGNQAAAASLWTSLLIPESPEWALHVGKVTLLAHTLISAFPELFAKPSPQEKKPAARSNILLQQAKLYIRDNLDRPLSLESVSHYLHVSRRHLTRLFAEGIHESFSSFVRQERIQKASHLLKTTELSIKEIAQMTGFGSVHSFTRAFTSERSLSPGKYRRSIVD